MSAYVSFLTVLGWSLLDSIWQMAILWLAYYMLTAGNIRISSAGKHNLILVFVFIGAEWFIYSLVHIFNEPAARFSPGFISVSSSVNRWIPYLSSVYIGVLLFRFLQYGFQSYQWNKKRPEKNLSSELQSFADRYSKLMGIPKRIHVYLSDMAETAQTSGFFKPFILLPLSLVTRLSPKQVEAILIHELFHIRRNDYLINIFISCFRSIFFFNPFAHLFYKALERERELACDDGVLEMGFVPEQYAEALFCLEKFRQVHPDFSLAANGNRPWLLMERICRLLGKPTRRINRFNPLIFFSLLAAFALFLIQPEKSKKNETKIQFSAIQIPAIPTEYEFVQKNIKQTDKEMIFRTSFRKKLIKKSKVRPAIPQYIYENESLVEAQPGINAYYADDKIARDYSNELAAGTNQAVILSSPGTPYLPPVSLSYQAIPQINSQDSIMYLAFQNGLQELVTANRIKTIASLVVLESEIEKNQKQLKEIELKNRNYIILDQRKTKPLLEEINHQIRLKKQKIRNLKVRLQNSEEEIIHI
ncbi:MAG TPA: M56 family metallopeptidase [Puia sp.]|nr:M56 family metallopeptidase [Puia sp.]